MTHAFPTRRVADLPPFPGNPCLPSNSQLAPEGLRDNVWRSIPPDGLYQSGAYNRALRAAQAPSDTGMNILRRRLHHGTDAFCPWPKDKFMIPLRKANRAKKSFLWIIRKIGRAHV